MVPLAETGEGRHGTPSGPAIDRDDPGLHFIQEPLDHRQRVRRRGSGDPGKTCRRLEHRDRRRPNRPGLSEPLREVHRVVLQGDDRDDGGGVQKHHAVPDRSSKNALSAGWPPNRFCGRRHRWPGP
jgi:hypothetical protein